MIDEILRKKEFEQRPPILIDIGASGGMHKEWKRIAPYSICVAFEPDDREMSYHQREESKFKKFYLFNTVAGDHQTDSVDFYLTKSPFCSSLLEPDLRSLEDWAFAGFFEVEKKVKVKARTLPSVLEELRLSSVDWFKTDSQGIDVRLFQSLGDRTIARVLAADFEPGIIDAYKGEDKLFALLAFMHDRPFWMSDMRVEGTQRLRKEVVERELGGTYRRFMSYLLRPSPCWAEVSYLNTLENSTLLGVREFLLTWVFATIMGQHGFALDVAQRGYKQWKDPTFGRMERHSLACLKRALWFVPLQLGQKVLNKILARVRRGYA